MAEESTKKEEIAEKNPDKKSENVEVAEKGEKAQEGEVKKKKKKLRRQVLKGQAHIQCTYNNTLLTFSDMSGKVLAWASAGSLGFKGAKKATPYAATQIVNAAAEKVAKYGLREIEVFVKGVGSGREASIRALVNNNFEIGLIKDITPIPHNGCRPRKPRRV
ncbi:MAG TPA: 30S ribosomal protein S11 [Candidatus Bathyarchaeia archaeon]|nr:30S ribosomal protein S11 [Candidatus Bathyarchaeia archaeon]